MKKIMVYLLVLMGVSAFAQNTVFLDTGINNASRYFVQRLSKGTKVIVFNFKTANSQLSDYILEELTAYLVNDGSLLVVDRRNLEVLQQELQFQLSGDVNEQTAQAIGMTLGAQTIILGSVDPLGDMFRMRARAIAVETAAIQGIWTANITTDTILAALLGIPAPAGNVPPDAMAQIRNQALAAGASLPTKPVKRIPVRAGNFELIQGTSRHIRAPIDMDRFRRAAIGAMNTLRYTIESDVPGSISFKHDNGDTWWVRIKLCYWNDEYWYEYIDSYDLKADPARNRIHRNYKEWIEDLDDELEDRYRKNR
jgi:TolB-like protein